MLCYFCFCFCFFFFFFRFLCILYRSRLLVTCTRHFYQFVSVCSFDFILFLRSLFYLAFEIIWLSHELANDIIMLKITEMNNKMMDFLLVLLFSLSLSLSFKPELLITFSCKYYCNCHWLRRRNENIVSIMSTTQNAYMCVYIQKNVTSTHNIVTRCSLKLKLKPKLKLKLKRPLDFRLQRISNAFIRALGNCLQLKLATQTQHKQSLIQTHSFVGFVSLFVA